MAQTSYSLAASQACAGMEGPDAHGKQKKLSKVCGEDIPFGRLLELSSDEAVLPQGAELGRLIGASAYKAAMEPEEDTGYLDGEYANIVRRGQIWVKYTGTAPTAMSVPNISHNSDDDIENPAVAPEDRGTVTGDETSTDPGEEVSAAPNGVFCLAVDTTLELALIELNLPG